ncbi:MAG: hypothetical protein U0324_44985 [Polyangiales bacterium]
MTTTSNAPPPRADSKAPAAPRTPFQYPDDVLARFTERAKAVEAEAAATETRDLKALLLHESAEHDERVRGDEPAAARGYLAAFNARAAFRPPLDALIRLYARRRSTSNLVKLFDALAKGAATPRERAEALCLRGELLEDRMEDPEGALEAYEMAVGADPEYRPAWLDLQRVAVRSGDHNLLVRTLVRLAELTSDATRRSLLLLELAQEQARVGTPEALDEAARCIREAAATGEGRWRALLELERFGEANDRPQDVIDALEGRAALAEAQAGGARHAGGSGAFPMARVRSATEARAVAAELHVRAAWLRRAALDPEGAHAAARRAVALLPDDPRYRFLAMVLADQTGDIAAASEHAAWLLARDYGAPSMRASLHFRVAESAALRGDLAAAASALQSALALDPDSAAVRGALLEQLVASGDGLQAVQEYDRLAEGAEPGAQRAALRRVGASLALALRHDLAGAAQRFRMACDDDPADILSRRALVTLLGQLSADPSLRHDPAAAAESARARVAAIDALLPHASDDDEKTALLVERFLAERHELRDHRAAAGTAELLVEATGESLWAMESAALLWAAAGAMGFAARWASAVADHGALPGGAAEASAWRAAAARWFWAAGEEQRARELAVSAHKDAPADDYLAALALRAALAARDGDLALDVARRRAKSEEGPEGAARWLLLAAALLTGIGAEEPARAALADAVEAAPGSLAVRAAVGASTRWRGDGTLRERVASAALADDAGGAEEAALGVELALVRAFVDHDLAGALDVIERVRARDGSSPAVAILHALGRGALDGPDAEAAVAAWQAVLSNLPSADPLCVGVELEVARALGASVATRDRAAAARELAEGDHPDLVAPRVLALLDAVQREGRQDLPPALRRLAAHGAPAVASALRGAALTALSAQGRAADVRALAAQEPAAAGSILALAEGAPPLERAEEHLDALRKRTALSHAASRPSLQRAAAHHASLARSDEEALGLAEAVLAAEPGDLTALDVQRCAGRRLGRWAVVAQACAALADRSHAPKRAAAFWEEAGLVAADALGDDARAEAWLRAALAAAGDRAAAYRKLRAILQERGDQAGLESLVTQRLAVVTEDHERAELFWEQARLRRALGLREGALESATKVVALEPEHVAARALAAEIHAASGRLEETAEALAALAACREAPRNQRLAARLGAIDLFDLRLERPEQAVAQIDALLAEGEADEAMLERGVSLAIRSKLWEAALRFARRAAERAERGPAHAAALLRVVEIVRDAIGDRAAALAEARRAHEAYPADLTALKALHDLSDAADRGRDARRSVDAIREAVRAEGVTLERVAGLTEAARLGGDGVLERLSRRLGAVLGGDGAPLLVAPTRGSLRDPALLLRYRHPDDNGRAVALLEAVLPDLADLSGATTDALRVGWTEKVRGAHPTRAALGPLLRAVGCDDFELYMGGAEAGRIAAVAGDPVAVVVGAGVATPLDATARFELARRLLLALRGAAALAHDAPEAVADRALAALACADLPVAAGAARYEAHVKAVGKALSRKTRKAIAESGRALAADPGAADELLRAARAMLSTARRGALAVSGDVAAAARDLSAALGQRERSPREALAADAAGRELALYAVSDALAQVVRDLGTDPQ